MPRAVFLLADYGHDPTEVAVPFIVFRDSGFEIDFVTEKGVTPRCDSKMLEGITGSLLGADSTAKKAYLDMSTTSDSFQKPRSWIDPTFSLNEYNLVFLAGGHEKGVRQVIDSSDVHRLVAEYFPKTARASSSKKVLGAICHGVQVLAFTPDATSATSEFPIDATGQIIEDKREGYKSIIHACKTTALPGFMESSIYQGTRLFLGDYYKTYGACTPNVEDYVKVGLDSPDQFNAGPGIFGASNPMHVEDDHFRYVTGRYPPDAEVTAKKCVALVMEASA